MKKIIYISLFLVLISLMLVNAYDIMENIRFSFSLCINNLFPSLIPFMILSNILINYDFVNELSNILGPLMEKVFKVNKNSSFAFVMSILSGTPSNSKYIKDLLDNDLIDIVDARKCLNFCHFTNPIFILGTIGYTFLKDKRLGLIILISHYLSSFIIGIFSSNKKVNINKKINIKNTNKNFINILKKSINSTIDTLLLILGIITTCIIITGLIDNILNINENKYLFGLIEITQGLKYLSLSNLSINLKAIIASFLISFGGLCIHAQVFTILDNKKIRYKPYLLSRIIHGILSSTITYAILLFFK